MRGGYRVGNRIKQDMMDIKETLMIIEDLITDKRAKTRIITAKKILDKYIEGKGKNEK
ncbi:hypothetical protein Q3V94_02660 [Caloramator sp. CAR-1]|uniref:hypothetical protein n=1 Tax=Caloramator sp. CAR-1 TaxID=3062777 RepID=UPI0026E196B5|nr:hypothetical protein [Caloramator sp. CAR-1]MDO6353986.1 hypothetical protein [Caloramator sp. CAR-1]